jgi:hypothetical protein
MIENLTVNWMQQNWLIILVGCFAGYVLRWMIRRKLTVVRLKKSLLKAGFSVIDTPPERLDNSSVIPYGDSTVREVRNIYCKQVDQGTIYLFDASVQDSEGDGMILNNVIAYVSPQLDLPIFTLESKIGGNQLMAVPLADHPDLAKRYKLYARNVEDGNSIKRLFSRDLINQLLDVKTGQTYRLSGYGDTIMESSHFSINAFMPGTTLEQLEKQIGEMLTVFRAFQGSGGARRFFCGGAASPLLTQPKAPPQKGVLYFLCAIFVVIALGVLCNFIRFNPAPVTKHEEHAVVGDNEPLPSAMSPESDKPQSAINVQEVSIPLKLPEISGFQCMEVEGHTECTEPVTGIVIVSIPTANSMICDAKTEYWVGKTEVTQQQWETLMEGNPSYFNKTRVGADYKDYPVEQVSWFDARNFLSRLNDLYPQILFQLPSSGQYELACHGNGEWWLPRGEQVGLYAYYADNAERSSHPVGQKQANVNGLYDILGNVYEWTSGTMDFAAAGDDRDGGQSKQRIAGGSWDAPLSQQGCNYPRRIPADSSRKDVGFRVMAKPL